MSDIDIFDDDEDPELAAYFKKGPFRRSNPKKGVEVTEVTGGNGSGVTVNINMGTLLGGYKKEIAKAFGIAMIAILAFQFAAPLWAIGQRTWAGITGQPVTTTDCNPGSGVAVAAASSDKPNGSPLSGSVVITQKYGVGTHAPAATWGALDLGLDGDGDGVADPAATNEKEVRATHDGVVHVFPLSSPGGNLVRLENETYYTKYAHLHSFSVEENQEVKRGDLLGLVGSTGQSSGPHLHYEVWEHGINVDPSGFDPLTPMSATTTAVKAAPCPGVTVAGLPPQPTPVPPPPGGWASMIEVHVDPAVTSDPKKVNGFTVNTQAAAEYVIGIYGSGPKSKFKAVYAQPTADHGCQTGLAQTEPGVRTVTVWACDRDQGIFISLMAHEIVHQLNEDRYGPGRDHILNEGLATWASGRYWQGQHPDWLSYIKAQGTPFPLAHDHQGVIATMNKIYPEWASFVEFLIFAYGRDKLDDVYQTGTVGFGTADYASVYGKDLAALEAEWHQWLDGKFVPSQPVQIQTTGLIPPGFEKPKDDDYGRSEQIVWDECAKFGVPRNIASGIYRSEGSYGDPTIGPNSAGAVGLMQVMQIYAPGWAKELGMSSYDLHDAHDNAKIGCFVLSSHLKAFPDNHALAYARYNWGPSAVDNFLAQHPDARNMKWSEILAKWEPEIPLETRGYVISVLEKAGEEV